MTDRILLISLNASNSSLGEWLRTTVGARNYVCIAKSKALMV